MGGPSRDTCCWLNILEGKVLEIAVVHRLRRRRARGRTGWSRTARPLARGGWAVDHAAAAAARLVVGARAHDLDIEGCHFEARPDLPLLVCPGAGFQAAFDVDAHSLFQVLGERLGALSEDGDANPLGPILPLALRAPYTVVRGHVEPQKRRAARRVSHVGIAAEVADHRRLEHRSAASARYSSSSRTSKCRITDSFKRRLRSSGSASSGEIFSFDTV